MKSRLSSQSKLSTNATAEPNINYPAEAVGILIEKVLERVTFAKEMSAAADVKKELFDLYAEVDKRLLELKSIIELNKFSTEYTKWLASTLDKFTNGFSRSYGSGSRQPITLQEVEKPIFRHQQERDEPQIKEALSAFISMANFFISLDFLTRDLVVVGANGSGKSTLASHFREHIKDNGVVISAQKVLNLPPFDGLMSEQISSEELKKSQLIHKNRNLDFDNAKSEFEILIQTLLAQDYAMKRAYSSSAHLSGLKKRTINPPVSSNLEKLLEIWNSIFSHLQIKVEDGLNIIATNRDNRIAADELSDGEKVVMFLTAHVLLCPPKGFVIVDEPEMYLHPSVSKKLWDRLKKERPDCVFIYLTHNLDFAASRVEAKKIWIRSFAFPNLFEFEHLQTNEIPEALLLEILGSRQNILFCEGMRDSLDARIYSVLFPEYMVMPVESCLSVIAYTRAFNKIPIPNRAVQAIGLVDGDYISSKQRAVLLKDRIFVLKVPHVENLIMEEKVIQFVFDQLPKQRQSVQKVKTDILINLKREKEIEVAKYVSAQVDHSFKDRNVASSKTLGKLEMNFREFTEQVEIDIPRWATSRRKKIDNIVQTQDYKGALTIFKSKRLDSFVNTRFGIKDFRERALSALAANENLRILVKRRLPTI